MIKMVALAGYLITVTAAMPLHHCDSHRSDAVGAAASGGCTHCVEACPTGLALDDGTSSQLGVLDGGHRPDDCFVCHVLAQKSLPIIVAAAIGWDEIVSEIPCFEPGPPTLSLRFSCPIRAPPRIA
jgi:NAD-dependent dihydropyrimidine dehydrogenase PreA subunit